MPSFLSVVAQLLLSASAVTASCNADNCLRALRNPARLEAAQQFCGTFTTAIVTATTASMCFSFCLGFVDEDSVLPQMSTIVASYSSKIRLYLLTDTVPSFAVTACAGDIASRVSSACSCVASSTSVPSTFTTATSSSTLVSTSAPTSSSSTLVSTLAPTSSSSTLVSTSAPTSTGFPTPKSCSNPQLSCQNTTVVEDLCCFNAPGGQLLLTQFWDTSPSTGRPLLPWRYHAGFNDS